MAGALVLLSLGAQPRARLSPQTGPYGTAPFGNGFACPRDWGPWLDSLGTGLNVVKSNCAASHSVGGSPTQALSPTATASGNLLELGHPSASHISSGERWVGAGGLLRFRVPSLLLIFGPGLRVTASGQGLSAPAQQSEGSSLGPRRTGWVFPSSGS